MISGHPDLPDLWVSQESQARRVRKVKLDSLEVRRLAVLVRRGRLEWLELLDSRVVVELLEPSDNKVQLVHRVQEESRVSLDSQVPTDSPAIQDQSVYFFLNFSFIYHHRRRRHQRQFIQAFKTQTYKNDNKKCVA